MAATEKEISSSAAKAVGGFREAIQDLLVPEIRSMKISIDALTHEMRLRSEQSSKDIAALLEEVHLRSEQSSKDTAALREEMRLRNDQLEKALILRIENISEKLDIALEVRERLVKLEAAASARVQ